MNENRHSVFIQWFGEYTVEILRKFVDVDSSLRFLSAHIYQVQGYIHSYFVW